MKNIKIIFAIFIICSVQILAQGGSNYSIFGIGDIHNNIGARYEAMGGTSIAVPSIYNINTKNPALWTYVQNTRIQAGYNYNLRHIEQGDNKMYQSNASVNQFLGIFAIDTAKGISASFGILPYSSVNYYIKKNERIKNANFDIYGESMYEGSGGVSQAYLGAAANIFRNLKVGLSVSAFFGKLNQNINTIFYDYINQTLINRRSTIVRGSSLKAGIIFEPVKNLLIGAVYDKTLAFHNEIEVFYDGSYNYVKNDSTYSMFYDYKLPDVFGAGVSYQINNYLIAADFSMQDFTNFGLNKTNKFEYRNSYNASIGLSRIGEGGFRKTIFDKTTYNLGMGYRQLYYKVFGQDINEYYGSVGFDVPVSYYFWLNTGFTFGVRGVNTNGAIKETFGRLNVNISLGETWFRPYKEEY